MSNRRLTIHDIATMAGVSAGTVSRVLNNREGVGPATRQRIVELVESHNFSLNATAQRLSTGRADAIGVAFPFTASDLVANGIYLSILGGIGDAAQEAGYDLLLLSVPGPDGTRRLNDALRHRRVDGVVLPAAGRRDRLLRGFGDLYAPAVLIGHRVPSVPWVDSSHDTACEALAQQMIAGGCRRLIMLNGSAAVSACKLRSNGFWKAVRAHRGVTGDEEEIGFDPAGMPAAIERFLARQRPLPTGVVAANDAIAATYLEAARRRGLVAPDDFAISGFDDQPLSSLTSPPLTTVRMPLYDLGWVAAGMLIGLVEGRLPERRCVVMPTEIIARGSIGSALG
jgi:LacI family transcriptional regulator